MSGSNRYGSHAIGDFVWKNFFHINKIKKNSLTKQLWITQFLLLCLIYGTLWRYEYTKSWTISGDQFKRDTRILTILLEKKPLVFHLNLKFSISLRKITCLSSLLLVLSCNISCIVHIFHIILTICKTKRLVIYL